MSDLGNRLRDIRTQQGLSLQDVEARSGGELRGSVVGAYERGERQVSVKRLEALARFYRVPVTELLASDLPRSPTNGSPDKLVIDLVALDSAADIDVAIINYVRTVQQRRGDYNGRVLTMRAADLDTVAATMNIEPETLHQRLVTAGVVCA